MRSEILLSALSCFISNEVFVLTCNSKSLVSGGEHEKERVEKWNVLCLKEGNVTGIWAKYSAGFGKRYRDTRSDWNTERVRETLSCYWIWLKYSAGFGNHYRDTGFGQNTERDLGNVIGTRDLATTRAAGFYKIWERMWDWERKRYWGCDRSSGPPFPDPSLGWQFYYNINIKSVSVKIVRAWNPTKQEENSQNHFHIQNNTYCLRETKLWEARFCKGRGS